MVTIYFTIFVMDADENNNGDGDKKQFVNKLHIKKGKRARIDKIKCNVL